MSRNVDFVVSRAGVGKRNPPLFLETTFSHPRVRANKGNILAAKDSDLIRAAFDVSDDNVWVERHGVTVRGERPRFLDCKSHTAADMAESAWPSVIAAQAAAQRAVPRGAKKR